MERRIKSQCDYKPVTSDNGFRLVGQLTYIYFFFSFVDVSVNISKRMVTLHKVLINKGTCAITAGGLVLTVAVTF